ncbi:hypothetical protein Mnod_5384 [Methylobacterium nodulans ORS 2060]|uniref:Uncharacterized protein n=1 Tax=Methylobacterium nodulans (strain LMG 21967 / CNCM I-2342 / ORS 2060) TaxID=460265 RepID=B8IMN6_METNO|nr:hypothetical protein Mnod_5384 [Methylobacterium nodulans ORS 2060]
MGQGEAGRIGSHAAEDEANHPLRHDPHQRPSIARPDAVLS